MIKYFKDSEFECKCKNCGKNVNSELKIMLDTARGIAGIPFVVNSGARCEEHNAKVGGSKTSSHLTGLAVDIAVQNIGVRYKMLSALLQAGFNRIGIADTFIHVDIDRNKPAHAIWLY